MGRGGDGHERTYVAVPLPEISAKNQADLNVGGSFHECEGFELGFANLIIIK